MLQRLGQRDVPVDRERIDARHDHVEIGHRRDEQQRRHREVVTRDRRDGDRASVRKAGQCQRRDRGVAAKKIFRDRRHVVMLVQVVTLILLWLMQSRYTP